MSDLNDFFAKKDRKKKKPGKAARPGSTDSSHVTSATNPSALGEQGLHGGQQSPSTFSTSKPLKGDDGWIELDEATKATVNTGGRTVAVFKRDADDRDMNGDADSPTEKFVGWSKAEAESGEQSQDVGAAPVTLFPSLADTADAPEVPVSKGTGTGSAPGTSARPRRFVNSNVAALKKMLEERNAQPKTIFSDTKASE